MIPEQGWKELTAPTKYKVFSTTGWSAPWFRKKHWVLVFPSEWLGFFTYTTTTTITITITADYPQTTPPKGAALNDAWDSVYWLAFDGILIYSGFWNNHPYITGYDFIPNIQQRAKVLVTAQLKMIKQKKWWKMWTNVFVLCQIWFHQYGLRYHTVASYFGIDLKIFKG